MIDVQDIRVKNNLILQWNDDRALAIGVDPFLLLYLDSKDLKNKA